MKIPCCKEHKLLKKRHEKLLKEFEELENKLETYKANNRISEEITQNSIFWFTKIFEEKDPELARIALVSVKASLSKLLDES